MIHFVFYGAQLGEGIDKEQAAAGVEVLRRRLIESDTEQIDDLLFQWLDTSLTSMIGAVHTFTILS